MKTEAQLCALAAASDWEDRLIAAQDPNTPPVPLTKLAADEDSDVRLAAAGNPSTPTAVLLDRIRNGREEYAGVLQTALIRLAKDEDSSVRSGLASYVATPAAALEAMAADEDWQVRWKVTWHTSTPVAALETLAKDRNNDVRDSARERLAVLKQAAEAPGGIARLAPVAISAAEEAESAEALSP